MTEKQKYRQILKYAWYIDKFNYKELAHRFLLSAYTNDIRILSAEKYNISYIIRGLKWSKRDMVAVERTQDTIFAAKKVNQYHYDFYHTFTLTDNGGEALVDLEQVSAYLPGKMEESCVNYLNEKYGKAL